MKKQEKKFVLAGFVLLAAITMVLLTLAGCKNDTVPEPTRYTVKFNKGDNSEYTGDLPADITVVSGTKLTAEQLKGLADTADYIFEGWYDGETKAEGGTYTVTKDVTLVAKWRDRGTVALVTFTPAGGALDYEDTVTLSSQEGATIHYTINDGEEKTGDSPVTVSVTGDTTITARATKDGFKDSEETKATYTVRKLEGITVTSPAQTVYSERQSFDPTGMVVTATYDDKSQREVTGWETDFNTVAGEKGLNKPVTVSYTEGETTKTTTFTVTVFPEEVKVLTELEYTSPNHTGSEWTYVAFGEWPQTIKEESVEIGSETLVRGGLTYYLGNDGNYYVKAEEKANGSSTAYKYSNGDQAGQGGTSTKWFKVEPIVWRVLTTSYEAPEGGTVGEILLLAEKILTGGIKWADSSNDYMQSYIRKWLNGNSGTEKTSDYNGDAGFLQTAFTESAQNLIADTTVDNSAASTTDAGNNLTQADGCSDTTDKIFLLSEEEATTSEYGFAEYNVYVGDGTTLTSTRIRVTTDYAKATGAYQEDSCHGGGAWWLRSPYFNHLVLARGINSSGPANDVFDVYIAIGGVVPALSISLGGN